jgi:acetolactate synthase-1/2/3 large subunit
VSAGVDVPAVAAALHAATDAPVLAVPGGGTSLDVIDALVDLGRDVVTVHHEATAAIAAGAVGRLSARPGAAIAIKGPGLANLVPGLGLATLEGRPVVALVEAHAPGSTAVHKRMDHAALAAGVAKGLGAAADADGVVAGAALAMAERPGAVVLELVPGRPVAGVTTTDVPSRPGPDPAALTALTPARRPLVVAGSAAMRAGWGPALAAAHVPVATSAAAKGLIDERSAPSAGVVTGSGGPRSPEATLLGEADLVVAVGLDPRELLAPLAGPRVVPVDPHATDPAEVLGALRGEGWDLDAVHGRVLALRDALVGAHPFLPAAVLSAVAERLGSARLVADTGDHCTIAEHVWLAQDHESFLGAGASRWMGTGLPTSLGATLCDSGIVTVAMVGDGGIGGTFGELVIAVERELPLLVLVVEDGGFASIRGRAVARGRRTGTLEHPPRGWARAAEGLGLHAAEVRTADQLTAALAGWSSWEGPLLVHCRHDPAAYAGMAEGLR